MCGEIVRRQRDVFRDLPILNKAELRALGEKKGFKLCSRIVNAALKHLVCDSELTPH